MAVRGSQFLVNIISQEGALVAGALFLPPPLVVRLKVLQWYAESASELVVPNGEVGVIPVTEAR